MIFLGRSIELARVTFGSATLAVAFGALAQNTSDGDIERRVARVSLIVDDGTGAKPTSGLLFRVLPTRRKYVADISEDGTPDKPVTCKRAEKFEAQAESKLDRPIAPVRAPCEKTLAFRFTRMFVAAFPSTNSSPFVDPGTSPPVWSSYASVFASAGRSVAASALNDAAKLSVAEALGDAKTDQFLLRDPDKGYALVFSKKGVSALKAKQAELGVAQTGNLDDATRAALARMQGPQAAIAPQTCKQAGAQFFCAPTSVGAGTQATNIVKLPELKF